MFKDNKRQLYKNILIIKQYLIEQICAYVQFICKKV